MTALPTWRKPTTCCKPRPVGTSAAMSHIVNRHGGPGTGCSPILSEKKLKSLKGLSSRSQRIHTRSLGVNMGFSACGARSPLRGASGRDGKEGRNGAPRLGGFQRSSWEDASAWRRGSGGCARRSVDLAGKHRRQYLATRNVLFAADKSKSAAAICFPGIWVELPLSREKQREAGCYFQRCHLIAHSVSSRRLSPAAPAWWLAAAPGSRE